MWISPFLGQIVQGEIYARDVLLASSDRLSGGVTSILAFRCHAVARKHLKLYDGICSWCFRNCWSPPPTSSQKRTHSPMIISYDASQRTRPFPYIEENAPKCSIKVEFCYSALWQKVKSLGWFMGLNDDQKLYVFWWWNMCTIPKWNIFRCSKMNS